MERESAKVSILVSNRGTGKTDLLKTIAKNTSQSKVLIVDTFDNPVWRHLGTWDDKNAANIPVNKLTEAQLPTWQHGIYFLCSSNMEQLMDNVEKNVWNCLLILEDATKYVGTKLTKAQKNFVIDSKQKNLDLIFVFHTLTDVPGDLLRVADYLILGKTGDEWTTTVKSKFIKAKDAFFAVKKSKNKYEKITVELA